MGLAIAPVSTTTDLEDLKLRLNKSLTVDDVELQAMLDAALAYYARKVGPITTKTRRYDGGGGVIVLPPTTTGVTSVAYTSGDAVNVDDLFFDEDTQILSWGYNTVGYFLDGLRNVVVTFTTAIPTDHREIILADVAGYFAATQRGAGPRSDLPGSGYDAPFEVTGGIVTLWPRIDNLAGPGIA